MKIVADDKIPFLKEGLAKFADSVNAVFLPGAKIAKSDLLDADALITRTRTKCNRDLLEGTKVRFIASATIGYDHIDTAYCKSRNIFWTNAPGCNSSSVAQYFASAILNLANERKFRLRDMTIGIVGVGNVGSKIAKFAQATGMKVLLNDPPRERKEGRGIFTDLGTIKCEADIISFHVPLTNDGSYRTLHLAGENFFREIFRRIIFVNSSRGEVADTGALKNAIRNGKVSDAVIDVWENEPDIDRELLEIAKLATPHIAGYSTDGKANGTSMCIRALSTFFGLGADEWYPEKLPEPECPLIKIDCSGKTAEQVLLEAINASYDISQDDLVLRNSPERFEKLRGEYPVRREFPAYSVKLKNDTADFGGIIKRLGFILHV